MIKIQCENQICGATFYFDEVKAPTAKQVRCPKCKEAQVIRQSDTADPKEEVEDWLLRGNPDIPSSPVISPLNEPIVEPPHKEQESEQEDFFTVQPKVPDRQNRIVQESAPIIDQIGWLVIHDEYTAMKTFNLRLGLNRIGRKSQNTPQDINVSIETADKYMSRHHCDLEVRWLSGMKTYEYLLVDRQSTNGTFVNARPQMSRTEQIRLSDGDTIQVGRTKLVLKLPSTVSNPREAENWVRSTDHFKTIIQ